MIKHATGILMYFIAVNKLQEFLVNVSWLYIYFSTMTPPSSRGIFRWRRKWFDFVNESMFFRQRRTLVLWDVKPYLVQPIPRVGVPSKEKLTAGQNSDSGGSSVTPLLYKTTVWCCSHFV